MDVVEAMKNRKSIRGFKPEPVSKEVLQEVLEAAGRAPSALNLQPWEFFVLAGEPLKQVGRENVEGLKTGATLELEVAESGFPKDSVFRKRQVELAKQLFQLMGIPREDQDKRAAWMELGFRYFDAPAALSIVSDRSLSGEGLLIALGAVIKKK